MDTWEEGKEKKMSVNGGHDWAVKGHRVNFESGVIAICSHFKTVVNYLTKGLYSFSLSIVVLKDLPPFPHLTTE